MNKGLGAALQAKMREMASVAVLKCYIKYLVKNNIANSAESVREKIGSLCSVALDRGELSQFSIEAIVNKVDKSALFLKTVDTQHAREKFIDMELVNGLMRTDCSLLAGEDRALIVESKELFNQLTQLRNKIIARYGDIFLGECQNFYQEYKNMFDSGFEKPMKEITGDGELGANLTL